MVYAIPHAPRTVQETDMVLKTKTEMVVTACATPHVPRTALEIVMEPIMEAKSQTKKTEAAMAVKEKTALTFAAALSKD